MKDLLVVKMVIGKINDKNYIVRYMKRIFLTSILSALLLTGCNNEESFDSVSSTVELKATIENSESRVAFNQQGKFLWTINDAIGVTTTQNKTSFSKMTINEGGAGQSTATFTGKYMSGTPEGYAVYPHNANHKLDGTTLTYHFPESYDYTIEDHDYFVSDGTGNSFNPPMWSEISSGKVNFKHLGGVLCIKIADLPAGEDQQLKLIASNKITGDFSTDLANSPVLETSTSTEDNTVTINYSNAKESTRVFYVPVPTGTYSKLTIQFEAEGETIEVPFENKVIKLRSLQILQVGEGSIEGGEDNSKVVMNLDELNAALDNENVNTFVLGDNLTLTNTLEIKRDITLDGNGKTLYYEGAVGGRIIDVKKDFQNLELKLKNITLLNNTTGYIERGLNYNTNGTLILENVTITSKEGQVMTYAINMPTSATGATVSITNSKITGNIALNVWGENSTIDVTNSDLTSVDSVSEENYAAIVLNNNGTEMANGTIISVTGGSITAKDENEDPSTAVSNLTETGVIEISNTTNVIGDEKAPVALVVYEGQTQFYNCMTLSQAISKSLEDVTGKASVRIIKDIQDLDADKTITIPNDKKLILDLNNHIVEGISDQTGANRDMFLVKGTMTVKNGTITLKHVGTNMGWDKSTNVFDITAGGVLNIENATIKNLGGSDMAFCVHLNNWGEVTLNSTNTNFESTYVGIRVFNSGYDMNNVTLTNCKILTGGSCIWVHNYTAADFGNDETKTQAAAERLNFVFTNTTIARTNNSQSLLRFGFTNAIYYSDIEMTCVVAGTEAALNWAFANKKNVILNNDINLIGSGLIVPTGTDSSLDLNGKTISLTSTTPMSMITNNGTLTIKDSSNTGKVSYTFNGTPGTNAAANTIANRGVLVVDGGEISNTGTGNQIGYAIDNYNGSTLTVNDGKITTSGSTYYDGIRLFCGSNETTVTVNNGEISTIWAQNPSNNKATEVKGTIIINGGKIGTTYFENYTIVKVKTGLTAVVTPYGTGSDNTSSNEEGGYLVYRFNH